ncbi:hypothetical protein VNO78_19729 [Psophocarpus tetragonolobus]|uniref:Uncharacterized protein n=1 Tax=Psophocarpus tetragonolobus TaxID=3891 RepID=A0AAN9XGH7_PSOTE
MITMSSPKTSSLRPLVLAPTTLTFMLIVPRSTSKSTTSWAVAEGNKVIEFNPSHSKAYLWKGTVCIKLEEYQTAKATLEMGASLAPTDFKFSDLNKQCDNLIQESSTTLAAKKAVEPENDLPKPPTVTVTKPKYRHEFYQKPDEVVLTIFTKGIPRDSITMDFGEQIIVPTKCRCEVMPTKIEICPAKIEHIQWTNLEFNKSSTFPLPQRVNVLPGRGAAVLVFL